MTLSKIDLQLFELFATNATDSQDQIIRFFDTGNTRRLGSADLNPTSSRLNQW